MQWLVFTVNFHYIQQEIDNSVLNSGMSFAANIRNMNKCGCLYIIYIYVSFIHIHFFCFKILLKYSINFNIYNYVNHNLNNYDLE